MDADTLDRALDGVLAGDPGGPPELEAARRMRTAVLAVVPPPSDFAYTSFLARLDEAERRARPALVRVLVPALVALVVLAAPLWLISLRSRDPGTQIPIDSGPAPTSSTTTTSTSTTSSTTTSTSLAPSPAPAPVDVDQETPVRPVSPTTIAPPPAAPVPATTAPTTTSTTTTSTTTPQPSPEPSPSPTCDNSGPGNCEDRSQLEPDASGGGPGPD